MKTRNFFSTVGIPALRSALVHKLVGAALLGGAALVALHSLPLHFFFPSAAQLMLALALIPGLYLYRTARVGLLYPARIGQLVSLVEWLTPDTQDGARACVCDSMESPEQLYRFKTLVEGTLLDLAGQQGSAERVREVGPGVGLLADSFVASALTARPTNPWIGARDLLCAHAAEPGKLTQSASVAGAAHWSLGAATFVGLLFLLATPLLTVPRLGLGLSLFLGGSVAAYLACLIVSVVCVPALSWELLKEIRQAYSGRIAAPEQIGALNARSANFREILTLAELDAAPDMPDGP